MQITIIDVSAPVSQGKYQTLEVSYKTDAGAIQGKKLVSFSNPAVFKDIQAFHKGDVVEVETVKDDKGYWQWKSISKGGSTPVATTATASPTRVTGSNYETAEERKNRQTLIVRQSSLSNAISLLTTGAKSPPKTEEVFQLAESFVSFVFNERTGVEAILDMEDDIPL